MKNRNFSYHILNSLIMDKKTGYNTLESLKGRIRKTFGSGVKFEYWSADGEISGEATT